MGAEVIPFVFEAFEYLGGYTDFSDLGRKKWEPASGNLNVTAERPAPNTVIRFQHR